MFFVICLHGLMLPRPPPSVSFPIHTNTEPDFDAVVGDTDAPGNEETIQRNCTDAIE